MNKEIEQPPINLVQECLKEAIFLRGQLSAWKQEQQTIFAQVQEAKDWLAKQQSYVEFLQHLQTMLQQKNIGAFSELLSYFVKDVLQTDKEIVFDLRTYRDLPALKIEALHNGYRESILEGNGGSIANIVSTGLRLIALSRLDHRKFIILDEPDCWLKPSHVPTFAKIIGEISSKLNIQTVIISHHKWEYFKDYGRVIELKNEGDTLITDIIHDTEIPPSTEDIDVIKKITLTRFMSHQNTTFELHPHLTCIVGENDIGKSVLATAMKAVSYADSSDSYIKHHEKEAQVLIQMTGNRNILWQRFLKTDQENTQKVKYSYYKNNVLEFSEYSAHDVPIAINQELNVCTTEDIDVHIGNQKQPVFLLSSDTTAQKRAKILSLGKESLIIQKMMENIKVKSKECKSIERNGEKRYAQLERLILALDNIEPLTDSISTLNNQFLAISKKTELLSTLNTTITALSNVYPLGSLSETKLNDICTPIITTTKDIDTLIAHYCPAKQIAEIVPVKTVDTIKNIINTATIEKNILSLELLYPVANEDTIDILSVKALETNLLSIIKKNSNVNTVTNILDNLERLQQITTIGEVQKDILTPTIRYVKNIDFITTQYETANKISAIKPVVALKTTTTQLQPTAEIDKHITALNYSQQIALTQPVLPIKHNTHILNTIDIKKHISQMVDNEKLKNIIRAKYRELNHAKATLESEQSNYLKTFGTLCPTCGQHITEQHLKGSEHGRI